MRANGNINCIIAFLDILHCHISADGNIRNHVNACCQNMFDIALQNLLRQTIIGDTIAKHTAQLGTLLIYSYLMPHLCQIIRRRQSAGATADNADGFACFLIQDFRRLCLCMIHCKAFQTTDIDSIIHHRAATVCFTGMLADIRTGGWEGVVLPNQLHCFFISALIHQRHIAGYIHMRRTGGNTGNGIAQHRDTASMLHMLLIILAEAANPLQNHVCRFIANRTACGIGNHLCGTLNYVNGFHGCGTVKHLLDQHLQLSQTNAAGHTFPTGLRMAQPQVIQRHIHRTQSVGTGTNAALHIPMQTIQDILGAPGRFNR